MANIKLWNVTFEMEKLLDFSIILFTESLKDAKLDMPYTKPKLFSFYESFISDPIDNLKNECDSERLDFYELILIMSWALHREWTAKVVNENYKLNCFDAISRKNIFDMFLSNLNCEEGMALLYKTRKF